jgi:hypothetical protein
VRDRRGLLLWAPRVFVAVVLGYALMASSVKALRWMPVESTAQRDGLESFRDAIGKSPTAVLVPDDYAGWRLRGVPYASPPTGTPAPLPLEFDLGKQFAYGQGVDFDAIPPSALDRFSFVVTPRTPYGSAPPPNFRLVRQTRLLSLWRRVGRTPARRLAEHDAASPGAPLACRHGRPVGVATRARAVVWPGAPVVASGPGALIAGTAVTVPLTLPKGRWDVSVQYTSTLPLRVQYLSQRMLLPANTNRPGPAWLAGRIRSRGGIAGILLVPEKQSRLTPASYAAQVGAVVATRVGPIREVPVRRACGRYVDRFVG